MSVQEVLAQFTQQYGRVEKIDAFAFLDQLEQAKVDRKHGKVILVSAAPPLKASRGEGKTTATIALIDALRARGVDAAAVLRQPSMGITAAGSKGGASGGGKASLEHADLVDWGLCGEMTAIAAAQNLLVSFAEKAVDEGKLDQILLPRVSEVPSRALRSIATDFGKSNIAERMVLTPTCEMMQIVVLSRSMQEIEQRIGRMIAGTLEGKPVLVQQIAELWRVMNILTNAVKPVFTRTLAGSPVYIHCGPFANVSLGIPSLVSVDLACAVHDVVVVEAGYGADAGAQKWLDVACREYGAAWPFACLMVTRASTWRDDPALAWRFPFHVQRLENLDIPTFPLVNLWGGEESLVQSLRETATQEQMRSPLIGNLFEQGAQALVDQLDGLIDVLEHGSAPAAAHSHKGMSLIENARWVCEHAYGVPPERVLLAEQFSGIYERELQLCAQAGLSLDDLALVPVKSPATMTDDDSAPEAERTVTLKKIEVHAGAGLVHMNLTTSLTTPMPKIV